MGKPMPPRKWYDSLADMAWWVGAAAFTVAAGGPLLFNFVACDMRVKATQGLKNKKGYCLKKTLDPLVDPRLCIVPREPNEMYRRSSDAAQQREVNLLPDLAKVMGAGYVHEGCLGGLVEGSTGPSSYGHPDKDAA